MSKTPFRRRDVFREALAPLWVLSVFAQVASGITLFLNTHPGQWQSFFWKLETFDPMIGHVFWILGDVLFILWATDFVFMLGVTLWDVVHIQLTLGKRPTPNSGGTDADMPSPRTVRSWHHEPPTWE